MKNITADTIHIVEKAVTIDEIMHEYGQEVLQLVFSYVNNVQIAEDLTQDIFVKIYHSLHTYKGQSKLRTWLWSIAINHCKDYLKSWYNRKVILTENTGRIDQPLQDDVEEVIIQSEEDAQIAASVMSLPIKYREVIYFYYFEELTIKEIAELLKINQNTIKTRLKRAKELLKARLEEL